LLVLGSSPTADPKSTVHQFGTIDDASNASIGALLTKIGCIRANHDRPSMALVDWVPIRMDRKEIATAVNESDSDRTNPVRSVPDQLCNYWTDHVWEGVQASSVEVVSVMGRASQRLH
jgi:hypothetical protein